MQNLERGIASHWKYKSSEKISALSWKEQILRDWLKLYKATVQNTIMSLLTQMFQDNVFGFTPKGAVIELPNGTPIDFAYAFIPK